MLLRAGNASYVLDEILEAACIDYEDRRFYEMQPVKVQLKGKADYIVFASAKGVRSFFDGGCKATSEKLLCIGDETAAELKKYRHNDVIVASRHSVRGLADAPRFTNYVIMPMSFLCNTFFSSESIPYGVGRFISLLPLSITCSVVRTVSTGGEPDPNGILFLIIYLIVFSAVSFGFVYKKKNL